MPESTADTSGGDSRYVAGSQPWNGKSGALITKANMKPRKIHRLALGGPSTSLLDGQPGLTCGEVVGGLAPGVGGLAARFVSGLPG